MRAAIRVWIGRLNLRRVKVTLVLLGSVLFMASSPGGCETTYDSSGSSLGESRIGSAAHLAYGATSLAWAPDGQHILFSVGGYLGVYIVDSAGLRLWAFPETAPQFEDWERHSAFAPSLSPDGSRVAYSMYLPNDNSVIETAAFDGSDVRRLTPIEPSDNAYGQHSMYPLWSADGQRIAFVSSRAVSSEYYGDRLFVMDADGSNVRAVAPSVRVECQLTWQGARWSPDGNWLALAGSEPGVKGRDRNGLYTVRIDGSGLTRISDLYVRYCGPAVWSPDSRQLAFMGQVETADGNLLPYFIAERDGSALTQLAETTIFSTPAWSPDGAWLAFSGYQRTSSNSRGPAFYVVRPDGTALRNVTIGLRGLGYGAAVWSPDGEEIWFESSSGGLNYAVRQDGSGLREVIPGGIPHILRTAWSPGDHLLAVLSLSENRQFKLYVVSRDGTESRVLVRGTADRLVAEQSDWRDVSGDIEACEEVYSGNSGLVRDCQTLLRMRDTLAGESFLNWSASIPIQHWQGISVDGSPPRVLRLGYLMSETLEGTIPPELGDLTELEVLVLDDQHLTGEIPKEIGSLKKLKVLQLNRMTLSGHIPSEIGKLEELKILEINGSGLSGSVPAALGNLSKLAHLDLGRNRLSGSIPPELGNLKSLQGLILRGNKLSGTIPPELGRMTSLERLILSNNGLTGEIPKELGSLENLGNLFLQGNYLQGCIPAVLSGRLFGSDNHGLEYCE